MFGAFDGGWRYSALVLLIALLFATSAAAEKRVALVIGNSAYQNVTRLDNPRSDAALMAETLGSLGFTLIGGRAQLDLDKPAMDLAVQSFGRQVQGADVALFYYAGHGVQVSGANYLVPVSANPTREADVDFQMVDVNLVLRQMQGSGTRLNMVILDACRNNPFGARGLHRRVEFHGLQIQRHQVRRGRLRGRGAQDERGQHGDGASSERRPHHDPLLLKG
jgi:uncharacterized caspase-like protein